MKKLINKQIREKLTKEFLIEQYIDLKKSTYVIAKEIGCSHQTILNKLNEYNIPTRTLSEAYKGMEGLKHSEGTCQKMSDSKKGHKVTEEARQKISDSKKGEKNYNFKGITKSGGGYILIYVYDHPFKNNHNKVFEHRLVVESQIGRYLLPTEVVHHINGIKDDNRIKNLMCFSSESAHQRFHNNPNNVKDSEIIFDGRKL